MTTPDRWQQIESLYHQAVAIPDGGRGEFLDQACADDALLRQEVESLLAYDSQAAVFLETPPDQLAADVLAGQTEALAAGQLVSHYEIVSLLSRGGMGEVYLARDTELNRQVALKLLPQHFSGDAIAVARLEREARAASALNHPGILTIYEFGRDPVGPFIVMEFVEGRTLRELSHKAVALEDVIEWGKQVAQALSEAHRAGIAHRDIKPENIMVRSDGLVKVLDFGLARLSDVVRAEYATVGASGTISGTLSGTLRYMSPEQSRGDTLTPATDIFSLGIVLYELATGLHPFSRDPAVNLLDAIQTRRPVGPASFRPDIPAPLAWLMVWMLDKDPKARPQAVEVAASFRAMAGESKPAPATQQVTRDLGRERSRKLRWTRAVIAATLLFAVALAGFWMWLRDRPTESPAGVTALTSFPGTEYHPSFSPDGEMVAFSWNGPDLDNFDVYLQSIGGTSPVRLTTDPAPDTYPVFSPDGRHVAFRRNRSELYIVAREGGPERKLAVTEGEDVAFTPDGRFLVTNGPIAKDSPTKALWLIPVDGGPPRRITFPPSGVSDVSPRFSPDGTTLAFVRMTPSALSDLYAVQIESSYSANRSTPVRQVTDDGQVEEGLAWAPDGKSLIFASTRAGFGRLWRVPASGGRITPVPEVGIASSYPAVSPVTNRLVYVYQVIDTNLWRLDLDNRGKPGPPKALSGSGWTDASPDVSPDGSRIAFMSNRRGDDNIWVSDTDGHNASQITSFRGSSAGVVGSPKWSPDGTRIAFDARIDGNGDIYVVNASGGEVRRLTSDPTLDVIPNWSRDGRWIYFTTQRTGRPEIWKVSPEGGPEIRVTTNGGFGAQESLDGRILFYTKQRSNAELWQRPVGGGPETAALEAPNAKRYRPFTFAYWSVSEKGIYFLEQVEGPPETATQYRIGFFDFASRDVRQIFTLGRPAQMNAGGLAVSPGGRSILYSQIDSSITDIMLVEGFQ